MENKNNTKAAKKTTRMFVPKYNKYMDELTDEEWAEMSNATCGTECDIIPDPKAAK